MKFSYLTGEVGNIGIVKIKKQAIGINWWLAGGIDPTSVAAVWQPKGAASLAASYLRIAGSAGYANIDPAIVGGVAPTWDATSGWIFNGSTQYLISGITPTNNQSWSAIVLFSNFVSGTSMIFGAAQAGRGFGIFPRWTDNSVYYDNGGEAGKASGPLSGTLAICGNKAYRNGVDEGITIPVGSGLSIGQLFIGAGNYAGTPNGFSNTRIQAIAIYTDTKTAPQIAAVHAAMMAL